MIALLIILTAIYAVGLLFTLGMALTNHKSGVIKDDSKFMVVFIYFLVWILSPALLIDFIYTTLKSALHKRK